MEHHHQLLCFSPQEHHIMISPGFFDVGVDVPGHFHHVGGGVFVDPVAGVVGETTAALDDGGWVEDLMQLGDELFGGGDNVVAVEDADVGDHLDAWPGQCEGSPDDDVDPPSGELACEPGRDDGDLSPSATRKRRDRSKTIVSERKRRVRMKEKLYELRSLVPTITKMDKASIIADAVVYVKNLQAHAEKLKGEVALLEERPRSPPSQQERRRAAARRQQGQHHGRNGDGGEGSSAGVRHGATVTNVGAAQVGEGRFFVTVECERRDGAAAAAAAAAAPLCAAVESLAACLRVESSNLGCSNDRVVSTLTLKVSESGEDGMVSEGTVKLWLMAALLTEGLRPESTVAIS